MLEAFQVGFALGREGVLAALRQVEAPGVLEGEVIESGEERQKKDRLQDQINKTDPAGGAKAVGKIHALAIQDFGFHPENAQEERENGAREVEEHLPGINHPMREVFHVRGDPQ